MWVPRFTGKTRITGKAAEIPEIPDNNREFIYMLSTKFIRSCINLFGAKSILYVYYQYNCIVLNI